MSRERQRHAHSDRLPRRPVDRLEDLVIWMLITLGLLPAVLAAAVAARRHGEGMHRVELETRQRIQVQAVLLEPAPQLLVVDDRSRAVRLVPASVPVRYRAPDGMERRATALVKGRRPAGVVVPVWVDRYGAITNAPAHGIDAVRSAAMGAAGVLAVSALVLGGIGAGVRTAARRFAMRRWEQEWEQVEPLWSGRAR
jgi:hypothetical protein